VCLSVGWSIVPLVLVTDVVQRGVDAADDVEVVDTMRAHGRSLWIAWRYAS
jgi:hypothetical protein